MPQFLESVTAFATVRGAGRVVRRMASLTFAGLLIAGGAGAQDGSRRLEDFVTRDVRLNASQLAALSRGETVVKMLPTANEHDVAVFAAVQVNVPRSFFIDRQRDFARALRNPARSQVALFRNPADVTDVQSLQVAPEDLKELRDCRPNDCNFKLPATDMDHLRTMIDWSAPDAGARVAAYARQRMVVYVTDYRDRGNAAMVVYDNRGSLRSSEALSAMLRDSSHAFSAVPSLGRYVTSYPRERPDGTTDVMFWSRDALPHVRPVLRITHESIYPPAELPGTTVLAAKQIYADHYFEAGLEVLAAVDRGTNADGQGAPAITLVADRRYRFDNLPSGGPLNIRGRVVGGLQDNVLADLKRLKRESEAAWAASHDR